MPSAGMVAKTTNVIIHPMIKANANPEMKLVIVKITVDVFSPMAPWKENVSVANLEES